MISVRPKASYKNLSSGFYRKQQEFKKQYCHIYASRLERLSELLHEKAKDKFGKNEHNFKPL